MQRYILAFVRNSDSSLPFSQEVFKVSEDCSAHDVTVPLNTVCFMFVHADADSAKEFTESFVTIKLGNQMVMQSSVTMTPEENGKKYWVGKIVPLGNSQGVCNEHLKAILPIHCLGENDEVIDL